jgi:hypothetical protein
MGEQRTIPHLCSGFVLARRTAEAACRAGHPTVDRFTERCNIQTEYILYLTIIQWRNPPRVLAFLSTRCRSLGI